MNINFNYIFKLTFPYLVAVLLAYIISSILYLFLPKNKPIIKTSNNQNLEYKKYKITQAFKEAPVKKQTKQVKKKAEYQLISNIVLKGIYAKTNGNGWIIIAEKSSANTHILGIGESFKEYKLKLVYPTYAVFTKNGNEYKLEMEKDDGKVDFQIKKQITKTETNKKAVQKKDIVKEDGVYSVKRSFLNNYVKKPEKIWKDIAIKEIMKDGEIKGFKINAISSNSVFKKLGLRKGDIIKEVNNIVLKSYGDAFKLYHKINKLNNLNIKIIRKDREMELDYEIQ